MYQNFRKKHRSFFDAVSKFLGHNLTHLIICVLGGAACFIPIILNDVSTLEKSILRSTLEMDSTFRETSAAVIALAFPLAVDLIFDCLGGKKEGQKDYSPDFSNGSLNKFERLVFLFGVTLGPIVSYAPRSTVKWALIYVCASNAQIVLLGGVFMASLCRYNKKHWPGITTIFVLTNLVLANVLSSFSFNSITSGVLNSIACFIFLLCCLSWLYVVFKEELVRLKQLKKGVIDRSIHAQSHIYFVISYVISCIVGLTIVVTVYQKYPEFENFDATALFLFNGACVVFEISIMLVSMRMVKFDVVQGLVSKNFNYVIFRLLIRIFFNILDDFRLFIYFIISFSHDLKLL